MKTDEDAMKLFVSLCEFINSNPDNTDMVAHIFNDKFQNDNSLTKEQFLFLSAYCEILRGNKDKAISYLKECTSLKKHYWTELAQKTLNGLLKIPDSKEIDVK